MPAFHPFLEVGALPPFRVVAALHQASVAAVMLLLVEVGLWPYPVVQALLLEVVELRPYQAEPAQETVATETTETSSDSEPQAETDPGQNEPEPAGTQSSQSNEVKVLKRRVMLANSGGVR